jgi:hypothetical protein
MHTRTTKRPKDHAQRIKTDIIATKIIQLKLKTLVQPVER